MTEEWRSRTALLIGEESVNKLKESNVLIAGVGGVGSSVAEMLVRAGVGHLTLIDCDIVNESNLNRQMIALMSTLGKSKVEVAGKRYLDINPSVILNLKNEYLSEDNVDSILSAENFDFVIDAIDTLSPKIKLLLYCLKNDIPVISAMGAGGKTDPGCIKQTDISKTFQCPLAKTVRRELKLNGILKGLPVVFSTEPTNREAVIEVDNERNKKSTVGTVSYMPVIFGCHMSAYVINKLIN